MKKAGNTSDFIEERNRELHRNFMEVLRTSRDVPLRDMFKIAASRRSSRFWVSEGRAAIVIGSLMRTGRLPAQMIETRRRMFEEIFRRVQAKMAADPALCMTHAVNAVIYEEAPEFYLTEEGAKSII